MLLLRQSYTLGLTFTNAVGKFTRLRILFDGRSFSMQPDAIALKKYVDKHYPDYEVYTAYESGSCGYSAHRSFESFGWHSLVVNPVDVSEW